MVVTVPVTVAGSITSSRGREEPEPDLLSLQVRQPGLFAGVVHGRKIRGSVTLVEHCAPPVLEILEMLSDGYHPVGPSGPSFLDSTD